MKNKILKFINDFKKYHPEEIADTFMSGYCYWFAFILKTRFNGIIYYMPILNHFITRIDNDFYDIQGELKILDEPAYPWETYKLLDPLETERIVRYCINKDE